MTCVACACEGGAYSDEREHLCVLGLVLRRLELVLFLEVPALPVPTPRHELLNHARAGDT